MKTFNFDTEKIQTLDFATLKATYKENDVYGNPLRSIYHFEVINEVMKICENNNLRFDIQDMFAANNNSKQFPGVSTLPQVEEIQGKGAPAAHILRRVYTTIAIHDHEDEEVNSNIAIAYHQDGIQVAFGTTVKICHNLCILGADKMVSNFGKDKISNEEIFKAVDDWLKDFYYHFERDSKIIGAMKKIECTKNDAMQLIGILTAIRVSFDNNIGKVKEQLNNYPLNQAQISIYTENYLRFAEAHNFVSLWDMYNIGTKIYKPHTTEIPNILPQTAVLFDVINDIYKIVE